MADDQPEQGMEQGGGQAGRQGGALPEAPADQEPLEFNEAAYLLAFPRLVPVIQNGRFSSAYDHYTQLGIKEKRLESPNYRRAMAAQAVLRTAAATAPVAIVAGPASALRGQEAAAVGVAPSAGGIDSVIVGSGGVALVIGWLDDRADHLTTITVHTETGGAFTTSAIARCRRADAENAIGLTAGGYLLGFWCLVTCAPGAGRAVSLTATVGAQALAYKISPRYVDDAQLRDTVFEYFAGAQYLGNPAIESYLQLDQGAGDALIALNARMSGQIITGAFVERHGPSNRRFKASIVVCLYGKLEFFFIQHALFSSGRDCQDYELVYVCNSPELTDGLQREAKIAAQIYGMSTTLVFLPGNAGFGAANNVAVQYARSNRVLILNPDVFPRDGNWAVVHNAIIDSKPADETLLFGAPLFYDDGSLMHGGMFFDIDRGLSIKPDGIISQDLLRVEHYGKGSPPNSMRYRGSRAVPAVTGAFISADRDWFEKLGGFSEEYVFGHYEDADICLKSFAAGKPSWLHDLPLWHMESKGSVRKRAHEGGTSVNRWHFTRTWIDQVRRDMLGRTPDALVGADGG